MGSALARRHTAQPVQPGSRAVKHKIVERATRVVTPTQLSRSHCLSLSDSVTLSACLCHNSLRRWIFRTWRTHGSGGGRLVGRANLTLVRTSRRRQTCAAAAAERQLAGERRQCRRERRRPMRWLVALQLAQAQDLGLLPPQQRPTRRWLPGWPSARVSSSCESLFGCALPTVSGAAGVVCGRALWVNLPQVIMAPDQHAGGWVCVPAVVSSDAQPAQDRCNCLLLPSQLTAPWS